MDITTLLSMSQIDLKKYMKKYLEENGYFSKTLNTEEYLFGIGEIPILLVAHLDTVHKILPKNIFYDKKQKVLWSPEGIGGDDRCGVFAIAKLIKKYKPYVLFTTDEEIGGKGAEKFVEDVCIDLKKYINFIIEIDRRGSNDAVFYDCGNENFKDYILSFGFEEEFGTFTDISILSPAYDIASVNLSSGYYNEHQKIEFIKLNELYDTIEKIEKILDDKDNWKYYNYQECRYSYFSKNVENKNIEKIATEEDVEEDEIKSFYINDYNNLSDAEFRDYYNMEKPKTLEEFLDYINTYFD